MKIRTLKTRQTYTPEGAKLPEFVIYFPTKSEPYFDVVKPTYKGTYQTGGFVLGTVKTLEEAEALLQNRI